MINKNMRAITRLSLKMQICVHAILRAPLSGFQLSEVFGVPDSICEDHVGFASRNSECSKRSGVLPKGPWVMWAENGGSVGKKLKRASEG